MLSVANEMVAMEFKLMRHIIDKIILFISGGSSFDAEWHRWYPQNNTEISGL